MKFDNRSFNLQRLVTTDTGFQLVQSVQIQQSWIVRLNMEIFAKQIGGGNAAYWQLSGLLGFVGSQLTAVSTTLTPIKSAGAATWDVRARIVGENTLSFEVQGASGMTVDWGFAGEARIAE